MMARKKAEKPEDNKRPEGQVNTLPDGSILDLSALPIGDIKLTDREGRFVFWYTYPGTNAFQHQTRAAIMAGYGKNTAYVSGCRLRQKENVANAIKRIMDAKIKADLEEEYHKIIELKKRRAHFDIGEYVKIKEKNIPVGKGDAITVNVESLKDLAELTPEQRQVIDGIDYKGHQAMMKTYLFADRERAMADLINLYQKLNGPIDENAYDFEATAEIIKEHLAIKIKARKKKDEIAEISGFMQAPGPVIEEL